MNMNTLPRRGRLPIAATLAFFMAVGCTSPSTAESAPAPASGASASATAGRAAVHGVIKFDAHGGRKDITIYRDPSVDGQGTDAGGFKDGDLQPAVCQTEGRPVSQEGQGSGHDISTIWYQLEYKQDGATTYATGAFAVVKEGAPLPPCPQAPDLAT